MFRNGDEIYGKHFVLDMRLFVFYLISSIGELTNDSNANFYKLNF